MVLGNIKNSIGIFDKKLVRKINRENPDMVISVGNAVADGAEDKYRILYKSLRKIKNLAILCIGENEVSDVGKLRFYDHFGPFYFSFALDNAYFIFLDTTSKGFDSWQREWLINKLHDSQKDKYCFIFMNKPPYQVKENSLIPSGDKYINDPRNREFLIKNFSKFKVTAVFCSNIEIFDRRNIEGVRYYITGGGGGGLILNDERSFYHYIKVYVTPRGVTYNVVRVEGKSRSVFPKLLENIWAYVHSFFYISIVDFLLFLGLLGLIGIITYIEATKKVDYHRDFAMKSRKIPPDAKLKMAMFTNMYLPFVGGVPISIQRLGEGLKKMGHKGLKLAKKYNIPVVFTYHTRLEKYAHYIPLLSRLCENIEKSSWKGSWKNTREAMK